MKTPDLNDLKLGTVVVLDGLSKPIDFGFKRSRVSGTGSSYRPFGTLHICGTDAATVFKFRARMHKCGYCLRISNNAGMRRVLQTISL